VAGGLADDVQRTKLTTVFIYDPTTDAWSTGPSLPRPISHGSLVATHINSGVAALVAAIVLGPRTGFLKEPIPPHNLTFVFIGAGLLWFGWFGFNAGSNLEANGLTAQAFLNTITAPAAAALAWGLAEKFTRGHASLLGFASGAVAGLVAITPAAGFAGTIGAIVLGAIAGVVCLWAVVTLKPMFKYDDSLDVFGIHGVGGIVGALGTAFVASPTFGGYPLAGYEMWSQFVKQLTGVGIAIVWSAVVALIAMFIVKAVFGGARVTESAESDGLDLSSHGERAYN
jgi:Amt family ammonium transporter